MLLKKGQSSSDVANWQRFLISQGFDIEADGDFGDRTEAATKVFQARNNLRADGLVGNNTFAIAEKLLSKENPLSSSDKEFDDGITGEADSVSERRLEKVHPILARKARQIISFAKEEGYAIQVSQGLRTFAEQDALFRKRPKVTNAKGGQSIHNYGCAVDFVFLVNGKVSWDEKLYRNIGRWASRAGLEWGGNWKFTDLPHCQLANMPSYKILLPVYQKGGVEAVWKKFVN